ncbi:MAG: SDR family NAD(P)-dependent oxidoreductase [Pseudomonadota bacterium]
MTEFINKYGPWALVTGANAGIGKAIATELASRGINIIGVARRQVLLDQLKEELEEDYNIEVRTIRADLTEPDSISNIELLTSDLEIGLVVPNAGIELSGAFIESSLAANEHLLRLNVMAPMQLAKMFGAKMAARGRGGILFISSLFGYQGIPLVANYAASKAYILSLGEALHVEMKQHGVDVTVVSPGLTDTDMPANMPINFSRIPIFKQQPEQVARTGIKALGNKATVVSGLLNKFYAWENRFLPRALPVALFGFLIRNAFREDPDVKQATSQSQTS